jgi:hypothetical protein
MDRISLINSFEIDFNEVECNFFMNRENYSDAFNVLNLNSFDLDRKIYEERHKEQHQEHNMNEECQHDTLCNNINFFDCNASSAFESFLIFPPEHNSLFNNSRDHKI